MSKKWTKLANLKDLKIRDIGNIYPDKTRGLIRMKQETLLNIVSGLQTCSPSLVSIVLENFDLSRYEGINWENYLVNLIEKYPDCSNLRSLRSCRSVNKAFLALNGIFDLNFLFQSEFYILR